MRTASHSFPDSPSAAVTWARRRPSDVAAAHSTGIRQVALPWLLHHADNVLLIPGTSSAGHLEQNMTAGDLTLTAEEVNALDALSAVQIN